MMQVLHNKIPWVGKDSLSRLVASYDPTSSGYLRYVRVSAALISCINPAMASLVVLLQKVHEGITTSLITSIIITTTATNQVKSNTK